MIYTAAQQAVRRYLVKRNSIFNRVGKWQHCQPFCSGDFRNFLLMLLDLIRNDKGQLCLCIHDTIISITLLDSIYIYLGSLRCFGINILDDFRIYYIILYKRKNIKNNKRYANWLHSNNNNNNNKEVKASN